MSGHPDGKRVLCTHFCKRYVQPSDISFGHRRIQLAHLPRQGSYAVDINLDAADAHNKASGNSASCVPGPNNLNRAREGRDPAGFKVAADVLVQKIPDGISESTLFAFVVVVLRVRAIGNAAA